MDLTLLEVNSTVVDFIGRSIIGTEEPVPCVNKAVLALYLINIVITNSISVHDYYLTIGDEYILQELLLDCNFLDNVYVFFVSHEYNKLGAVLSSFMAKTARKFNINVSQAISVVH